MNLFPSARFPNALIEVLKLDFLMHYFDVLNLILSIFFHLDTLQDFGCLVHFEALEKQTSYKLLIPVSWKSFSDAGFSECSNLSGHCVDISFSNMHTHGCLLC